MTKFKKTDSTFIDCYIGAKIKDLRIRHHKTRKDLAQILNITHQQLHKYENGRNKISINSLFLIAQYFNVHIMYFFDTLHKMLPEGESYNPPQIENSSLYNSTTQLISMDTDLEILKALKNISNTKFKESVLKLINTYNKSKPL